VDGSLLLTRWVKPHDSIVLGSATCSILNQGLDGTSNNASRHRQKRPRDRGHATHRRSHKATIHLNWKGKRASLEGSFVCGARAFSKSHIRHRLNHPFESSRGSRGVPGSRPVVRLNGPAVIFTETARLASMTKASVFPVEETWGEVV